MSFSIGRQSVSTEKPSVRPPQDSVRFAAIGASAFFGKNSSAPVTATGSGMILVTIDRALMQGSKTPKPPARKIHAWPGCHFRTSSFHSTKSFVTVLPASSRFASSTPSLYCECQVVISTRPFASASRLRSESSDSVAAGGFSSITCLPASSAARAIA